MCASGDFAVSLSAHTATKGFPTADSAYLGFQRGKYTALIDVAAYGGKPNAATVLSLARLLDARIYAMG